MGLIWLSCILLIVIASATYNRWQRRTKWAEVLANAHRWAASVGGTLKRVSEQPPVYDPRGQLIARRYRITFADQQQAECIAVLRYTCADGNWALEKLARDAADHLSEKAAAQREAELSAESHARRHRAKVSNVPVIFAPPKRRKPPRRST